MKKLVMLLVFAFCLSTLNYSCKEKKETESQTQVEENMAADKADIAMNEVFACPMDCEDGKTYDEPGKCPVCEMDLKKVEPEEEPDGEDHEDHDND